ncbi:hypothetical protein Tco_0137960 [Tanacetum coccineum]
MIVMMSMIDLECIFAPLFDEYVNGKNEVVSKSSAVTTTDASDKRQQQSDTRSSTSILATIVIADGNFDLTSKSNKNCSIGEIVNLDEEVEITRFQDKYEHMLHITTQDAVRLVKTITSPSPNKLQFNMMQIPYADADADADAYADADADVDANVDANL